MNIRQFIKGSPLTRLKGFAQELTDYSKEQEEVVKMKQKQIETIQGQQEVARAEAMQATKAAESIYQALS